MTRKSYGQLVARGMVDLKEMEKKLEIEMSKAKTRATHLQEQRVWNRPVKTYSRWLKVMKATVRLAQGGGYLDQAVKDRAIKRMNRSAKRMKRLELDAGFIPGHIKRNAQIARG